MDAADSVRPMKVGEVFQVLEGPKEEEKAASKVRAKVRAVVDGAAGWITLQDQDTMHWSSFYKCLKATALHEARLPEGGNVLRQVGIGEVAELLEGPVKEGEETRMKCRLKNDGMVGWVTTRAA